MRVITLPILKKIAIFAAGFAIGNTLVPYNAFADEPNPFYNETQYVAECNNDTLTHPSGGPFTVFIFGDVGSDYENFGLELNCGDTFTLNDSFIASIYSWSEYAAAGTVLTYDATFTLLPGSAPTQNETPHIWGDVGIFGSTSMIAAVGGGVRATGGSLWTLFVFLGVALAFVIALQVVVFSKRSFGTQSVTNDDPERSGDVVDAKDKRAYRRGRKVLEKDYPDLYK